MATSSIAADTLTARAYANARPRAGLRIWILGFIIWTALALLSALQVMVQFWARGQDVPWTDVLPRTLLDWHTCAIFTPLYFWMVRRWPLERTRAGFVLAVYAAITAVMVVLKYALYVPLVNTFLAEPGRTMSLRTTLAGSFIRESIAFWCMLAVILAIEYYRTQREREMREVRLQTQLAEARLDALAAQLHPHFLFNTIQGISTLIHRDPAAADGMLANLSTLLRHTLQRDEGHEIPLAHELELLSLYLDIVQQRFGDRLTIARDIAPDASAVLVPRFLLQPLVENALQHGIERTAAAGRIDIRAVRDGGSLVLAIADDGPGIDTHRAFPGEGIGLANTRNRLLQLYGAQQSLHTTSPVQGGFVVTVRIPWRTAVHA
jgi:two-component system LytT family sensor kinase